MGERSIYKKNSAFDEHRGRLLSKNISVNYKPLNPKTDGSLSFVQPVYQTWPEVNEVKLCSILCAVLSRMWLQTMLWTV